MASQHSHVFVVGGPSSIAGIGEAMSDLSYLQQKLFEAVGALVSRGPINKRLTHAGSLHRPRSRPSRSS